MSVTVCEARGNGKGGAKCDPVFLNFTKIWGGGGALVGEINGGVEGYLSLKWWGRGHKGRRSFFSKEGGTYMY